MDNTIKIEFYIFLTSIYGGLIAGIVYDIYRINRNYFKPKKIATLIEDFLFWVVIGFVFFYMLNKNNWAELRLYVFLGFFIGGIIYIKILSKFLFSFLTKVFKGILNICRGIKNLITLPFKALAKFLKPKIMKMKRLKRIPKESFSEMKRYKKIIFKKK